MAIKMQQRRGLAADWTSADPILAAGEIGFESDTGKFKIGTGSAVWTALPYYSTATNLEADIEATSPIVWTPNAPGVDGAKAVISFSQSAQDAVNDVRYVKLQDNTTISPLTAAGIPLTIDGADSQTAILQKWAVNGVSKAEIDKDGDFSTTGFIAATDNITSSTGNIVSTAGNINASTTDTSGTAGIVNASRIRLGDTTDVTSTSTRHAIQVGPDSGADRLMVDANEIHVYNGTTPATLTLNGDGGPISIASANATATTTVNGPLITATGTSTIAPLKIPAGVVPTNPAAQTIESTSDGMYLTSNPGSNTTGVGRGLITAPQMIFSLANSGPATTNTAVNAFASANSKLSVLEPAKLYRFSGKYYVTSTFTTASAEVIQLLFAFSNAQTAIKYSYKTYNQTAGTTAVAAVGTGSAATAVTVSPAIAATVSYVIEFEGYFTTHATLTSTLTPQFQMSTTGASTVVTTGSYFQVEKLGSSSTTLISGNWSA